MHTEPTTPALEDNFHSQPATQQPTPQSQGEPAAAAPQPEQEPADERPEMSAKEASWHEVIAGQRAAAAARAAQDGGETMQAVAESTTDLMQVGPYQLHPATPGTAATLQALSRKLADSFPDIVGPGATPDPEFEPVQQALILLVFLEPRRVLSQLKDEDGFAALLSEADDLAWSGKVSITEFRALDAHAAKQIAELTGGKAPGTNATEPTEPTEPTAPGKLAKREPQPAPPQAPSV